MVKELRFYKVGSKDLNGMVTESFDTKEEAEKFLEEWAKKYPKIKETHTIWLKILRTTYDDDGNIISRIEMIDRV